MGLICSLLRACAILSCLALAAWIHGKTVSATPPVLSSPTGVADGTDHALLTVSTDIGSGTLYYDISTSCGLSPTATQVKTGAVTGHVANGNQAVSSSGTQSLNPIGVSAVTAYCVYFAHNAAGGDSNVISTSSFTTPGVLTITRSSTAAFSAAQGGTFDTVADSVISAITNCFLPVVNVSVTYRFDYAGSVILTVATLATTSYSSTLRGKLIAQPNLNTSIQQAIFNNPPAADPTGLGDTWQGPITAVAALGIGGVGIPPQSTTTVASTVSYDTSSTPTNCSTDFCLWTILLHEITEGMGRIWGQNYSPNTRPWMPEFSSYGSAGNRQVNGASTHYPSIDGGSTSLITPFNYATSGDPQDWDAAGTDAFTSAYSNAHTTAISALDIKNMAIMGWTLSHNCRVSAGL